MKKFDPDLRSCSIGPIKTPIALKTFSSFQSGFSTRSGYRCH